MNEIIERLKQAWQQICECTGMTDEEFAILQQIDDSIEYDE